MKILRFLLLLLSPFVFAQQITKVDFKTLEATVAPNAVSKQVTGTCKYSFSVGSAIDTINIDAVNIEFSNLRVNNKTVPYKVKATALQLYKGFKKGKNTLTFDYIAKPKQTLYFTGSGDNLQIWTQGQGKETSHWLPSFNDVNEKVVFNLTILYDPGFEIISNGVTAKTGMETGKNFVSFRMDDPMSSYLVMLAIGKFRGEVVRSQSGVPILLYVRPQDEQKCEPTFRYTKQIFDFFEREIGVKYPWKVYKQIPVTDFLYAGMENTSATLFSQDFVVDSIGYNDRNYINVNAHELAHQWFGDYVTAVSGTHHWLQEGFATYYALLAEEEIFGADHFSYKLYEMAEELQHASETDTIPILNPKASSLTFYKKGAWALHALRNEVGTENFRKAVKNYLNKYAFKNVTTENFLAEVKKVTPFNEKAFRQNWLENPKFEVKQAISILKKNSFVSQYLDILEMTNVPFEQKRAQFEKILTSNAYHPIKEEVIFQTSEVPFEQKQQLLNLAISTNEVRVRQVVANSISKVPESFYLQYTSLLNDPSYITREMVTNILWSQFPERRKEILDSTSSDIGFNDKNLRIQWLTLALITQGYKDDQKIKFYEELLSYGTPDYESSVRQNALTNLLYIDQNDKNVLAMLVRPLTHHRWQFSKFARDKIRELIKKDAHRSFYLTLLPTLEESEKNQLNRLLNP